MTVPLASRRATPAGNGVEHGAEPEVLLASLDGGVAKVGVLRPQPLDLVEQGLQRPDRSTLEVPSQEVFRT